MMEYDSNLFANVNEAGSADSDGEQIGEFTVTDEIYEGHIFDSEKDVKTFFHALYPEMMLISRKDVYKTGVHIGKPKAWRVTCKYGGPPRRSPCAIAQRASKKCGCQFVVHLRATADDLRPVITSFCAEHSGHVVSAIPRSVLPCDLVTKDCIEQDKDAVTAFLRNCIIMKSSRQETFKALLTGRYPGKKHYSGDAKTYLQTMFSAVESTLHNVCNTANLISELQNQNKHVYTRICPSTGVIRCVLWLSEMQLSDIAQFGDVLIIDTTAKKNNLKYPLILVIGINAENKSIILAQGLLHDETYDSFRFVMESLLHASAKQHPSIIFSDEDPAMLSAYS